LKQLAHFTWTLTDTIATDDILHKAMEQIIDTNLPLYQNECDNLSSSRLNLLVAIAAGEKMFTSVDVMNKYGLGTPQNVSKNKKSLQQADVIDKTKNGLVFLDPVFERWFKMEYVR
jgi:hypothetical protein